MKLQTKLVAVNRVSSSLARSSFPSDQIDKVANLIISAEGVINPIIMRRTSFDSYEVIEGHFEYYAAVRARELSILKGEMIQAIILEPENEETLLEQVNILRRNSSASSPSSTENSNQSRETINLDQVTNIEDKFINLEKIFKAQFDELQKANRSLENQLTELFHQNQKPTINEELVNQIAQKVSETILPIISSLPSHPRSSNRSNSTVKILLDSPINLNMATEEELSKLPGIRKDIPALIVEERNAKGTFSAIEQLIEVKGIGSASIDRWKNYLVI